MTDTENQGKHGEHRRTVAETNVVAWCPECGDPMHLKNEWPDLLDGAEPVPKCPDCDPSEWIDFPSVKIESEEADALVA